MKIAIIGAGVMGRAILSGLRSGTVDGHELRGTTRRDESAARAAEELGMPIDTDNLAAIEGADLAILCLKPKNVLLVAEELAAKLAPSTCVVSIAAGVPLEDLSAVLPDGQPLVRAMPNTPCLVGAGMTVLSAGPGVSEEHLAHCRQVFGTLGRVLELEEEHMNAVTGLSASGPAFLYLVIESLADGGVMTGLPRSVATELAAQAVLGAASMVLATGRHPADLKDAVTTPAGCTISALLRLEDGKLRSVLARGVQEAAASAAALRQQERWEGGATS